MQATAPTPEAVDRAAAWCVAEGLHVSVRTWEFLAAYAAQSEAEVTRLEAERLDLCRDVQLGRDLTDEVTGRLYVAAEALREAKAALQLCLGESHLCTDHNPSCRVCVQRAALARIEEES